MEWVDPDNWSGELINQATPHVERIPCVHDTVEFNPGNSFSVIAPDVPINIGSMKFGNQVSATIGQIIYNIVINSRACVLESEKNVISQDSPQVSSRLQPRARGVCVIRWLLVQRKNFPFRFSRSPLDQKLLLLGRSRGLYRGYSARKLFQTIPWITRKISLSFGKLPKTFRLWFSPANRFEFYSSLFHAT